MSKKNLENIGMNVKMLRIKHNMSQEEAAKIINKTPVSYRDKEKGKIDFGFSEILNLMDYWKEDLNELTK